jgi:hypothetical protein
MRSGISWKMAIAVRVWALATKPTFTYTGKEVEDSPPRGVGGLQRAYTHHFHGTREVRKEDRDIGGESFRGGMA